MTLGLPQMWATARATALGVKIASPVAPSRHPDHIAAHDKKAVPPDALPGAVSDRRRFRHRRLGALFALSRDRILARWRSPATPACRRWSARRARCRPSLFKNSVFGIVALVIATLNLMRPSIVLLTRGMIAACLGIVLYNVVLSGLAIGLLILGFARPAPATA